MTFAELTLILDLLEIIIDENPKKAKNLLEYEIITGNCITFDKYYKPIKIINIQQEIFFIGGILKEKYPVPRNYKLINNKVLQEISDLNKINKNCLIFTNFSEGFSYFELDLTKNIYLSQFFNIKNNVWENLLNLKFPVKFSNDLILIPFENLNKILIIEPDKNSLLIFNNSNKIEIIQYEIDKTSKQLLIDYREKIIKGDFSINFNSSNLNFLQFLIFTPLKKFQLYTLIFNNISKKILLNQQEISSQLFIKKKHNNKDFLINNYFTKLKAFSTLEILQNQQLIFETNFNKVYKVIEEDFISRERILQVLKENFDELLFSARKIFNINNNSSSYKKGIFKAKSIAISEVDFKSKDISLYYIYPSFDKTLDQEIQIRKSFFDNFSSSEFFQICENLIKNLHLLKEKKMHFNEITPKDIIIVIIKGKKYYKLMNFEYENSFKIDNEYIEKKEEEKISSSRKNTFNPPEDKNFNSIYKSNIYCLGLCFLQAALLEDIKFINDKESYSLIVEKIERIEYSDFFKKIIKKMLALNEENRINTSNLIEEFSIFKRKNYEKFYFNNIKRNNFENFQKKCYFINSSNEIIIYNPKINKFYFYDQIIFKDGEIFSFNRNNYYFSFDGENFIYIINFKNGRFFSLELSFNEESKQQKPVSIKELNKFEQNKILPSSIVYHNDNIFIIGGNKFCNIGNILTKDCFVYKIKENKWKSIKNLPKIKKNSECFTFENKIYTYEQFTYKEKNYLRVFVYNLDLNNWEHFKIRIKNSKNFQHESLIFWPISDEFLAFFNFNQSFLIGIYCEKSLNIEVEKKKSFIITQSSDKNYFSNQFCFYNENLYLLKEDNKNFLFLLEIKFNYEDFLLSFSKKKFL